MCRLLIEQYAYAPVGGKIAVETEGEIAGKTVGKIVGKTVRKIADYITIY